MIEVEELRKVYTHRKGLFGKEERVEALRGVSFQVNRGEVVAYLGPNGSGKSTTVKVLAGVLVPDGGKALVNGFIPWERKREFLESIGVLFGQRSGLIWDIPVRNGLRVLKELYGVDEYKFREVVDFVDGFLGVSGFWDRPPRKLSLGQRVRSELMAVLVHDPDVLLLDEPTIGVDIWTRIRIRELLRELARRGKAILLTTHQLEEVEAVADRIVLIHEGRILFDGKTENLLKRIRHKIMKIVFREEKRPLNYEVVKREGNSVVYKIPRKKVKEAVIEALEAYDVVDLSVEEPGLETALLELTGI